MREFVPEGGGESSDGAGARWSAGDLEISKGIDAGRG